LISGGEDGGEQIAVGIKSNTQPDDGSEAKIYVDLAREWHTYDFPLANFSGADLARLYVVAEFVFLGGNARTVYFRNIEYHR
jgi:hypothetical protein